MAAYFAVLFLCIFPQYLNCAYNDNYTNENKRSTGQIVWQFDAQSVITSSPAYSEGIIYVGAGNNLFAIDTAGKEVFRFKTGGPVKCKVALNNSGVYFQSGDGYIYCLDKKTGKKKWKLQLDQNSYLQLYDSWDYYHSSPIIVDNMLYVGSSNCFLYALNCKNGNIIWKYKTNNIIRSAPVYSGGRIYFGSFDGFFYALESENGKEVWKYKIKKPNFSRFGEIQSSAAISGGKIFFGSRDGNLHALDLKSGKDVWQYSHKGSWVITTPIVLDTMVIAGSSDEHFVNAVSSKTGNEIWRYNTKTNVFASPAISDGIIYCGEGNAYSLFEEASFFAIDALTGKEVWKIKTTGQVWSSPLVVSGKIFFCTIDGKIYSVR